MSDTLQFQLVYDATRDGRPHWGEASSYFLMAFALTLLVLLIRFGLSAQSRADLQKHLRMYSIGVVLLTVMATFVMGVSFSSYNRMRNALAHGDYTIVTGVVSQFVPGDPEGHGSERFLVGQSRFEYSEYVVTPAFHRTVPEGGPMRDGLRVRITDVGGEIARLEIAR